MVTSSATLRSNISDQPNRWAVYVLYDKAEPNKVRYVGLTCDPRKRLSAHRNPKAADQTHRANWARKVRDTGSEIIMEVVIDEIDLDAVKTAEMLLIAYHRENGGDLVNSSDGGDGVLEHSPETRARISAAKKAYFVANPEAREVQRQSARMNVLSVEARDSISRALTGVPRSEETRRRISAGKTGSTLSTETRAKISASLTGRKQSKETIAKRMATISARLKREPGGEEKRDAAEAHF